MAKGTPHHPRVTAKDVTRDLGLSYSAVSLALGKEDGYGVSPQRLRLIRQTAHEMGFHPQRRSA